MTSNVLNDMYPLVLHGYLRKRVARYVVNILMLRCVLLGMILWETISGFCTLAKGCWQSKLRSSSKETKLLLVAWLTIKTLLLTWICLGVSFPVYEYSNCRDMVHTIAGLELVLVTLVPCLTLGCMTISGRREGLELSILGCTVAMVFASGVARVALVESYTFVEDAGMCSWRERQGAFVCYLVFQSLFWLYATGALLMSVMQDRKMEIGKEVGSAWRCFKHIAPTALATATLAWTAEAWSKRNTYGSIEPVNLLVIASTMCATKFTESLIAQDLDLDLDLGARTEERPKSRSN